MYFLSSILQSSDERIVLNGLNLSLQANLLMLRFWKSPGSTHDAQSTKRGEMHTDFWSDNLSRSDHLKYIRVD
jgi:hypothetical protein